MSGESEIYSIGLLYMVMENTPESAEICTTGLLYTTPEYLAQYSEICTTGLLYMTGKYVPVIPPVSEIFTLGMLYMMATPQSNIIASSTIIKQEGVNQKFLISTQVNPAGIGDVIDPQRGANVFLDDNLPVGSINAWRSHLTNSFGFAGNNYGSGAQITLAVDQGSRTITGASIINPGNGFYSSPLIAVNGDGTGAQVTATVGLSNIGIISTNLAGNVYLDMGVYTSPALLSLNGNNVTIENQGIYTNFPYGVSNLVTNEGYVSFIPSFSINQVTVVNPGKNYTVATADIGGNELLPYWMSNYSPCFDIGTSTPNTVVNFSNLNVMNGTVIDTNFLNFEIKGLIWKGTTGFDFYLDNKLTDFQETITPENTTFDKMGTQFDQVSYLFSDKIKSYQKLSSSTQKTRVMRMKTRLDSGNVLVDTK